MAAALDMIIRRGDTWARTITWSDGTNPIDLTGCAAKMQIRTAAGTDETPLLELNTTPAAGKGDIAIVGVEGKINLSIGAALCSTLDFSDCAVGEATEGEETATGRLAVYDLELTLSGVVSTLIAGTICLVEDVTK